MVGGGSSGGRQRDIGDKAVADENAREAVSGGGHRAIGDIAVAVHVCCT